MLTWQCSSRQLQSVLSLIRGSNSGMSSPELCPGWGRGGVGCFTQSQGQWSCTSPLWAPLICWRKCWQDLSVPCFPFTAPPLFSSRPPVTDLEWWEFKGARAYRGKATGNDPLHMGVYEPGGKERAGEKGGELILGPWERWARQSLPVESRI